MKIAVTIHTYFQTRNGTLRVNYEAMQQSQSWDSLCCTYQAREQAGGYEAFIDSVRCSIASKALSLVLDRPLSKRILQAPISIPLRPCLAWGLHSAIETHTTWQKWVIRLRYMAQCKKIWYV